MYRELDERLSGQPLTQSLLSAAGLLESQHAFGGAAAAADGSSSSLSSSSSSSRTLLQAAAATTAATAGAAALPPLPATAAEHCQVTIGNWCGPFFQQVGGWMGGGVC